MRKAPPKSPAPATVADLAPAPYNPRTITDEAARALEASMVAFGDISGIVFNFTTGNLVAGHQRRRVLQGMGADAIEWAREEVAGVDGPERRGTIRTDRGAFGVRGVHWPLEKEMAANVAANSPTLTGIFDDAMLGEVLGQIEAADADLFGALRFEELWEPEPVAVEEPPRDDGAYTRKITPPIYEPRGRNPEVSALYDTDKRDQLLADINAAHIPANVAGFLREAACRHTIFNYAEIAEFYAHAAPAIQVLMERSALVIIDFNAAIEGGFVRLSERIGALADIEGGIENG